MANRSYMDSMEENVQRLARISRGVTLAYLALGVLGALLTRLGAGWLDTAGNILFWLAALLFAGSWLMPGFFVLRRTPWYALTWLEAANPFVRVTTRWEQLPDWRRVAVHLISLLLGGFMLALLINVAAMLLRR